MGEVDDGVWIMCPSRLNNNWTMINNGMDHACQLWHLTCYEELTKSAKVIFFHIFKCIVNLRDTNNHHTFDYILASSELLMESWTLYWNLLKPMLSLSKGTLCICGDNTQVLGCCLEQHRLSSNAPQTSLTSGLPVTNLDHIISNGCHFRIVKYEL